MPGPTPEKPAAVDPQSLALLACPVCHGSLQLSQSDLQIQCTECHRTFPLVDGIPVLIPDRAI